METTRGGIGFAGLLGLAFIVLKLVGVINWRWIWVLCPLWAGLAIVLCIALIVGALFVFAYIADAIDRARIKRRKGKAKV